MKILKFDESKAHLNNQYERFYAAADNEKAREAYSQIKQICFNEASRSVGFGKAVKYYFENVELSVNPYDIFADMANNAYTPVSLRDEEYCSQMPPRSEYAENLCSSGAIFASCDFGHTSPDWNYIFENGITGILSKASVMAENPDITDEQRDFYLSVIYSYEGVLTYIKRLISEAESFSSPNAKFAAENLSVLLKGAPQTLAQAMQLYFIFYTAQLHTQGNTLRSLGAVDALLYPYFKHDTDCNICTENEARELIRYFLYKWSSMHILANIPFNLCTEINRLTYLILEEYSALDIPDPKIHIKCTENVPDDIYRLVMASIQKGNNSFVFMNDRIVKKALIKSGIEPEDAEHYTVIGCYEPCATGKEIPCTLNGRINMPLALEALLNNGKSFLSGKLLGNALKTEPGDFKTFYSAFKSQLKIWSEVCISEINSIEEKYPLIAHSPILSGAYECCMQNGRDAYSSGAKYNNSSICIFGLATAVDSLIAIKKAVFEDKLTDLKKLGIILKNNWAGEERLQNTVRKKYPKFGNNSSEADKIARDLTEFMSSCINGKANGRGGCYRMGLFSIDWIIEYGKMLGATADGRLAGEPVSKNLSASVGMDKNGITGLIGSVTKLDFTNTPNGAVLDLHLHPSAVFGNDGLDIMISILKTYLSKGGFAVHINVLDPETLKKAQAHPENCKNLQVRLCGWNVYFTDLDAEMQNNFIKSLEA